MTNYTPHYSLHIVILLDMYKNIVNRSMLIIK